MAYEYREVVCPYCEHRFMFNKGVDGEKYYEYTDKTTGKILSSAICPKCGKTVIAIDKVLEGIREDDDRVVTHGIRGL